MTAPAQAPAIETSLRAILQKYEPGEDTPLPLDLAERPATVEDVFEVFLAIERARGPPADRVLKLPEVCELVGLSRASVYRLLALKKFPKPLSREHSTLTWKLSQIREYIAELEAA